MLCYSCDEDELIRKTIEWLAYRPTATFSRAEWQAQVRIEGSADPALLRVLLECLRA